MAFISLEDVTVSYPLKNKGVHTVFSNLELHVGQGEFLSIIGETGCGKSTLLRLLLGSERPLSGRVLVNGHLVTHPSRDRGYVPQKYSLFPDKTVLRNVAFGPVAENFALNRLFLTSWWKHRSNVYNEAAETLRRVGLTERDFHKYPDQLSGGMQQRVAIAQSLVMHPQVLLMDESFSALDPNTRKGMQRLLRSIWQSSGTTIVFVTHNLSEAIYLGNRVLVIAKDPDGAKSSISLDLKIPENIRGENGELRQAEIDAIIRRLEVGDPNCLAVDLAELAQ